MAKSKRRRCLPAPDPDDVLREWTVQQARNLALTLGKRFGNVRFLICDRGSNFTRSFDAVFQAAGTRILRTAVQASRMNAACERLIGTRAASSPAAC